MRAALPRFLEGRPAHRAGPWCAAVRPAADAARPWRVLTDRAASAADAAAELHLPGAMAPLDLGYVARDEDRAEVWFAGHAGVPVRLPPLVRLPTIDNELLGVISRSGNDWPAVWGGLARGDWLAEIAQRVGAAPESLRASLAAAVGDALGPDDGDVPAGACAAVAAGGDGVAWLPALDVLGTDLTAAALRAAAETGADLLGGWSRMNALSARAERVRAAWNLVGLTSGGPAGGEAARVMRALAEARAKQAASDGQAGRAAFISSDDARYAALAESAGRVRAAVPLPELLLALLDRVGA